MYKVNLGMILSASPLAWQEFIHYIDDKFQDTMPDTHRHKVINQELLPYHAVFYINDGCWLDFETETDYAVFLMKYGE